MVCSRLDELVQAPGIVAWMTATCAAAVLGRQSSIKRVLVLGIVDHPSIMPSSLLRLPDELLAKILSSGLTTKDLHRVARTCHRLFNIANLMAWSRLTYSVHWARDNFFDLLAMLILLVDNTIRDDNPYRPTEEQHVCVTSGDLHKVRHLSLRNLDAYVDDDPLTLLELFPALDSLTIEDIIWSSDRFAHTVAVQCLRYDFNPAVVSESNLHLKMPRCTGVKDLTWLNLSDDALPALVYVLQDNKDTITTMHLGVYANWDAVWQILSFIDLCNLTDLQLSLSIDVMAMLFDRVPVTVTHLTILIRYTYWDADSLSHFLGLLPWNRLTRRKLDLPYLRQLRILQSDPSLIEYGYRHVGVGALPLLTECIPWGIDAEQALRVSLQDWRTELSLGV
ncbi:hypothetical protein NM688_g5162 [Phlebia brevispora]|uniref:Uncharacterized protein n=1 Tax=Phlebia brevispora TaxID=194682 RepID=A0ACC1SZL9_9APHY|nr:hypothetical protein NM688_g5162 [Phlebia brevispora]